ncbi:putative zinc finger domain protein [Trypanosoma conorhini]|uniref:Palmitoyltransferase n=1 Tax=Trypanosoma conorhini TaxID=83891 RepID=A0A3R7PV82_9TRYP|nr:putative zinc finger domain protein [Trypanosoma conorhini]RNF25665.1 putative zinc finger domain protein [Trypanosoma conorhini]
MVQPNGKEWRFPSSAGGPSREEAAAGASLHRSSSSHARPHSPPQVTSVGAAQRTAGGSGRRLGSWLSDSRIELATAEQGETSRQRQEHHRRHRRSHHHSRASDDAAVPGTDADVEGNRRHKHHKHGHRRSSVRASEGLKAMTLAPAVSAVNIDSRDPTVNGVDLSSSSYQQSQVTEVVMETPLERGRVEEERTKRSKRMGHSGTPPRTSVFDGQESDADNFASDPRCSPSRRATQQGHLMRHVFVTTGGRRQLPVPVHVNGAQRDETAVLPLHHRVSRSGVKSREEGVQEGDGIEKKGSSMNDNYEPCLAKNAAPREGMYSPLAKPNENADPVPRVLVTKGRQQWCPREVFNTEYGERPVLMVEKEEYMDPVMQCVPPSPEIAPHGMRGSSRGSYSPMEETLRTVHASESDSGGASFMRSYSNPPCASCCVDRSVPDSWQFAPRRRHAFQWPLHYLQIIALSVTALSTFLFWISVVPSYCLLYRHGGYLSSLPELAVLVPLTGSAILSTCILWGILSFRENGDISNEGESCAYCRRLTNLTSRHCKACNKCISGFDHHCKWLNVCIGEKNYRFFIGFIVSALLSMLLAFISGVVLLAKWWTQLSAYSWFFRIAPLVLCVLMLAAVPPLVQLLGFHIMLRRLGMTTFEYIMRKRRQVVRDSQWDGASAGAVKELQAHEEAAA